MLHGRMYFLRDILDPLDKNKRKKTAIVVLSMSPIYNFNQKQEIQQTPLIIIYLFSERIDVRTCKKFSTQL